MINAAGAALLTKSEGIRLKAYFCPAGVPTIGRGHTDGITAQMVRDGYTITADEERALFQSDMEKWESDVLSSLTRKPNENQLAAFICLAYNIGIGAFRNSTVVRKYEAGDDVGAAAAFHLWNKATVGGKKVVLPGLVTRRAEEAALFMTPVSGTDPIPQAVDSPDQPKEKSMLPPFLLAALPALLEAVPKLASVFGSGTERSDKNVKAIELVAEVAKTAVDAVNHEDLVEKLKDPAAVLQVKEAVEANWFAIVDTAGTPEARKADAAFVATGAPVYRSPAFAVGVLLLPLVYGVMGAVVGLWGMPFSDDVRSALAGSVVGAIIGAMTGYWFGTSASSARKTELLSDK